MVFNKGEWMRKADPTKFRQHCTLKFDTNKQKYIKVMFKM